MYSRSVQDDKKWLVAVLLVTTVAAAAPVVALGLLGALDTTSDKRLAAVLALVGVVVSACVSLAGSAVTRASERRLERQHADEMARLRLDGAMRAGELFSRGEAAGADPAAVASGLLALTQLGRADLAVALLVDLWGGNGGEHEKESL